MPINSLHRLLEMFPYFFDKSETSNFYKSQQVTNNQYKKIYNDLTDVYESFHLNKKLLVWKEQQEAGIYVMRFVATFPLLKNVKIFCDDNLIYESEFQLSEDKSFSYMINEIVHSYTKQEIQIPVTDVPDDIDESELYETITEIHEDIYTTTHTFDENIRITNYSYKTSSEEIIPLEKYYITVTTFDEYTTSKGFPENNTIQGDIYDHDISLDEFGAENNIPRREYTTINESEFSQTELINRYQKTDPPFNNEPTEDDYHYMKRLLKYLIMYHTTPLPVLEIWKLYGIEATLTNSDKFILRLFDEKLHPPNEDGEFTWVPEPWEHKDFFVDEENVLGEYFFVSATTLQPVKHQNITFYLKWMNSLAEILNSDLYTVDIFLNGEPLITDCTDKQYLVDAELLTDDFEGNLFVFHAKKDGDVIKVIEVPVKVRGCGDADFYVKPINETDIVDGSYNHPFTTVEEAMEHVNGVYNLIAIFGDVELNRVPVIEENCTIIGCNNASIINNAHSSRFFNIKQGKTLIMQDITLVTHENVVTLDNDVWINSNSLDLIETVVTPSVDYGVLFTDLINATTFIKDIHIEGHKIVFTVMEPEDFNKLSDTEGLVQNFELNGHNLVYTSYSPLSDDELSLKLPYIHLDDRLELDGVLKSLVLEGSVLKFNKYGDEIAWDIQSHLI